ncbi:hypothetical protein JN01_0642 [Entomoplasma freundtii]|uniref:Uncharacterized protein n=1 Tax=Entomoplasma freundtii TaxID=74700 RepID=A0A2K8NT19_9MOLU|nr:hypothetical protein EFREU_v1c02920 [Entomoplasma freundtii]TDY56643.1 hypothetical protein JN01_0642 [Entomoplasma freundtii]
MLIWTICLGALVLLPWFILLGMLAMKYVFNKPVNKQWKIFFISLGIAYGILFIIAIFIFIFGQKLFG